MGLIKGITITLYEKIQTGTDDFNRPVFLEKPVKVENVLVAPVQSNEVTDATNLSGKMAVYTLAIPKGDKHTWENRTIEFFGQKWRTVGFAVGGIENLIPLGWNKKIQVERYE